jgi:oligopeptide/dipeptide ABC transporter ATP-binding protein
VFEDPQHPYTQALLSATLPADPTGHPDRVVLSGEIPSPIDLPQGCYLASRCPYVRDRCRTEPQVLRPLEGAAGHRARCWRVVEGDLTAGEIEQARERALAEERARAHDIEVAVDATAEDASA